MEKRKVLIIDDSEIARELLRVIFRGLDFEIIEAVNGRIGLERYKESKPDLVTLDITMPELDGYSFLEQLMKIDSKANVIIVSAIGQKNATIKCLELGAKAYITKPYSDEDVISKVKKILFIP